MNTRVTADVEITGTGEGQGTGVAKRVYGVTVCGGGSAAGIIILRNGTAVSDTIVYTLKAPQGDSKSFVFPRHIVFDAGLFADIGGSGAEAIIFWDAAP